MIVWNPELGKQGRFANWLIQYMMGYQLARKLEAEYRTPYWIGEELFGFRHKRFHEPRPFTKFNPDGSFDDKDVVVLDMFFNVGSGIQVDFSPAYIKWLFCWQPDYDPIKVPEHYVVIHNRQGDFRLSDSWPHVELEQQYNEAESFGFRRDWSMVLSDDNPVIQDVYPGLDYLYDFQLMCRCKHLFVYPMSTFSDMASKFNPNRVYLPTQYTGGKTSVKYVRA